MVQRHLAGSELQHHRLALIDVHHDLLTARQQVRGGEGIAMWHLIELVRAWDHTHRAVFCGAVGERDPCGDDVRRLQAPVGRVLVPRHVARVAPLLDKERGAPAQDVGADDVLHGIQDAWVADQVVQPGEQQMRLVAHRPLHAGAGCLERLESAAQCVGVRAGQHGNRGEVAVFTILPHGGFGQGLHRRASPGGRSLETDPRCCQSQAATTLLCQPAKRVPLPSGRSVFPVDRISRIGTAGPAMAGPVRDAWIVGGDRFRAARCRLVPRTAGPVAATRPERRRARAGQVGPMAG